MKKNREPQVQLTSLPSRKMTKILLVVIGLILASLVACPLLAQENAIAISGYAHGTYSDINEADVPRARLNIDRQSAGCGWQVEIDISAATDGIRALENSNFVQRAFVRCRTEHGTWSAGRIPLAARLAGPAPNALRTVAYPTFAFGVGAWGVQYERTFGEDWLIVADLAGNSSRRFQDSANLHLDRVEGSLWIKRRLGPVSASFTTQISDFMRVGLTSELNVGHWHTFGNLTYTDENQSVTGFVLVERRLTDWLAPHVQYEELVNDSRWTAGVGLGKLDSVFVVIDVIDVGGGEEELGARLQLRF